MAKSKPKKVTKPDPKKMAGEFPTDWAAFADLSDDSVYTESIYLLIAKAKMLNKRYKGKSFDKYGIKVTDVRVCDLGVYCLFYLKNTVALVTKEQCKAFEAMIKHEAETYYNLKPSFEYMFSVWK